MWTVTKMVSRVALAGHAYSGKTSIAKELEKFGYKRFSLANPIKEFTKDKKGSKGELRREWVYLGRFGRFLKQDIFVEILLDKTKDEEKVVVDDVRFLNEATYLYAAGFKLFLVHTPYSILKKRAEESGDDIDLLLGDDSEKEIELILYFKMPTAILDGTVSPALNAMRILSFVGGDTFEVDRQYK